MWLAQYRGVRSGILEQVHVRRRVHCCVTADVVIAGRTQRRQIQPVELRWWQKDSAIVHEFARHHARISCVTYHMMACRWHIIDTAGLRDTEDQWKKIGVERAMAAIADADRILLMVDASQPESSSSGELWPEFLLANALDPAR